jgi:hypothetical protein
MNPTDQDPVAESTVAGAKRHPWSRAEVRLGAAFVALAFAAVAISHVVNANHPATGRPFGGVTSAPVAVNQNTPNSAVQ